MNVNELKIRVAEVLGVSETEKDLAFDIMIDKIFQVLDNDETIKIPEVGFFQFKVKPFNINDKTISTIDDESRNALLYVPLMEDISKDSRTLFLTFDVTHQKKDLFELDENVFSIGVGKSILPIYSAGKKQSDTETSYVLLKKSIEERVSELISDSEHLKNFDLWDDYLSTMEIETIQPTSNMSSTIHKLTDDIEYTEEEIQPNITLEDSSDTIPALQEIELPTEPIMEVNKESIVVEDKALEEYNEFIGESQEGLSEEESNSVDEESLTTPSADNKKYSRPKKFWGLESFKSFGEERKSSIEEENDNINWNWGDELINGSEDESIDDESLEHEFQNEDEEEMSTIDDKTGADVFDQLENSDINSETPTNGIKDENSETSNEILPEDNSDHGNDKKVKINFIRNFLMIFGGFVVTVVLILIFIVPRNDSEKPVIPVNQDSIKTQDSLKPPVQVTAEAKSDDTYVPIVEENPIVERTRQIQQQQQSGESDFYRNIQNESVVRGLITSDGSKYFVQVSSWPEKSKAEVEVQRLRRLGYDAFIVSAYIQKYRSTWYRVKIGPFDSDAEAEQFLQTWNF
ncbi:MAG: hypothetical protein A2V66_01195 [Ignavibacteria bacterium RBG_13_36_8]|nr:MAG: hypothetical protein A2V66_01195 [Ignavibacteria bacterium RBG_13_36_8]